MHIILYESSSHGGCYKYAIELYHAYSAHPEVDSVTLLLPANAAFTGAGVEKILIPDNKPGSKWHFIYRHFCNPLRLLGYVRKAEGKWLVFSGWLLKRKTWNQKPETSNLKPETLNTQHSANSQQLTTISSHSGTQAPKHSGTSSFFLLLNDFEQMSAPLWSPLFRQFLRKHKIGVFLHDADRDAYPPSPRVSGWCMKQMMKSMHIALHHGTLPTRPYYAFNGKTEYLKVNHGLYHLPAPDEQMLQEVVSFTRQFNQSLGIIGHIREEKNYRLVMQAMKEHPHLCLVVAGNAANSQVDVDGLKQMASALHLQDRVLWVDRYLSEPEMTAVINAIDWVVLYYASSFHAQSGILNQTAPLKKPVLVSDLPNALTETVDTYQLGLKCKADDAEALSEALSRLENDTFAPQWSQFFDDVDWKKQTERVLAAIKGI